jgi:hypothetical protein
LLKVKSYILSRLLYLLSSTWIISVKGEFPQIGLIAFWHGYMLPCWYLFRTKKPIGVVSQSKDGSLLSDYLEFIGFQLIRGSSSKDGKRVLQEIILSSQNNLVLLTPDGPRGPIKELKAGVCVASARAGSKIYYLNVKMSSYFVLNKTWDKFQIPYPFSKIDIEIIEYGSVENNNERITLSIQELNHKMNNE